MYSNSPTATVYAHFETIYDSTVSGCKNGARIVIFRALYNTLQEEELTPWTEAEIKLSIASGEEFDSYRINYLFKPDFGRKPLWPNLPRFSAPSPPKLSSFNPPPPSKSPPPASLRPPIPLTPAPPADIRLAPEISELPPATATTTSVQPAQPIPPPASAFLTSAPISSIPPSDMRSAQPKPATVNLTSGQPAQSIPSAGSTAPPRELMSSVLACDCLFTSLLNPPSCINKLFNQSLNPRNYYIMRVDEQEIPSVSDKSPISEKQHKINKKKRH